MTTYLAMLFALSQFLRKLNLDPPQLPLDRNLAPLGLVADAGPPPPLPMHEPEEGVVGDEGVMCVEGDCSEGDVLYTWLRGPPYIAVVVIVMSSLSL
jgi:hypothetical protein